MSFSPFKILKSLLIREEDTLTPREVEIVPGGTAGTKTSILTSQTSNQTITIPDATTILVGDDTFDTLTNKTLTAPAISAPTGLVKGDVGLGNVDNTSDATKDAATATLTNKTLTAPVINSPTGLVKADVGLSNVDNTSDATKNAASVTLTNKTLTTPTIGDFSNANHNHTNAAGGGQLSLTTAVTDVLPLANGGTNKNITAVNGGLVYSDADSMEVTAAGTAQQWVLSGGAGAPTMSNTTTTGKVIDGSADQVQLSVIGHSTQTVSILAVSTDGGTNILRATNDHVLSRGTTLGDNAVTGDIGEHVVVQNISTDTNFPSSGNYGGDQTISLTAGDWDLSMVIYVTSAGTITVSPDVFIGTATGNSTSGRELGGNYAKGETLTAGVYTFLIPNWRQNITSTTSYYVKVRATYTGGPPTYRYTLSARRQR